MIQKVNVYLHLQQPFKLITSKWLALANMSWLAAVEAFIS